LNLNRSGSSVQHLQMCSKGRQAFQGLQSSRIIIGTDEVREVGTELLAPVVMLDGPPPSLGVKPKGRLRGAPVQNLSPRACPAKV